jgi:long-chain acyl-CoA synthetase
MIGYFNKPAETAEALDAEGFFHTGDVGVLDEDGFLKITDRKKDIIVTAGGKNIAPQNIENMLKAEPYISNVMVHGDRRKFLSALIVPDLEKLAKFAAEQGIKYGSMSDLVKDQRVVDLIQDRVDAVNKQLARYETIKTFAILDREFTLEDGELTPTLKVKRKPLRRSRMITRSRGRSGRAAVCSATSAPISPRSCSTPPAYCPCAYWVTRRMCRWPMRTCRRSSARSFAPAWMRP